MEAGYRHRKTVCGDGGYAKQGDVIEGKGLDILWVGNRAASMGASSKMSGRAHDYKRALGTRPQQQCTKFMNHPILRERAAS